MDELREKLQPKSVVARISYRKKVGDSLSGRKDVVVIKGMKHCDEEVLATEKHETKDLNPNVGFKCLYYSVSESLGVLKAIVVKKTPDPISVGIRTIDDTALDGSDYRAIDKVATITASEYVVEV